MKQLAEDAAASDDLPDEDALVERWDGAPEKIAEDIFRVRNKNTAKLEPLELFYPYQPKLLHAFFYGDESIINVYKGRRIGVSFIFCVAITIDALIHDEANFAIVSRTKSQSQERIDDIRSLLEHSRLGFDDLDSDLPTNNKGELELPNGAKIRAFSGDPESARGMDSARKVFTDEQAFLEDQKATMAAFMPFINLIEDAKMLQVSTPKISNDLFLETHRRGSATGNDGVISVKQPSFENPDDIDITQPLTVQDVTPVRPDMDVAAVEAERAQDPQAFAQEYLCRPISDEYRFFTSAGIERAQQRGDAAGYIHSPATHAREGGTMVMGVDIGIDSDDSAISVFEHVNNSRLLRFHSIVNRGDLNAAGVGGDPKNPSDLAEYITAVVRNMGIDHVFLDKTGPGRGFQSEVEKRLGRMAQGFNFSAKDEVRRMMGDFNYALHNDLITLHPDPNITDQLESIVKVQRHETSKPRFTGKEHAKDGKDDLAMSLVLGAYPPNFDADRSHKVHSKDGAWGEGESHDADDGTTEGTRTGYRSAVQRTGPAGSEVTDQEYNELLRTNNRTSSNYSSRHGRSRRKRSRY